jgi:hypothetical protein
MSNADQKRPSVPDPMDRFSRWTHMIDSEIDLISRILFGYWRFSVLRKIGRGSHVFLPACAQIVGFQLWQVGLRRYLHREQIGCFNNRSKWRNNPRPYFLHWKIHIPAVFIFCPGNDCSDSKSVCQFHNNVITEKSVLKNNPRLHFKKIEWYGSYFPDHPEQKRLPSENCLWTGRTQYRSEIRSSLWANFLRPQACSDVMRWWYWKFIICDEENDIFSASTNPKLGQHSAKRNSSHHASIGRYHVIVSMFNETLLRYILKSVANYHNKSMIKSTREIVWNEKWHQSVQFIEMEITLSVHRHKLF